VLFSLRAFRNLVYILVCSVRATYPTQIILLEFTVLIFFEVSILWSFEFIVLLWWPLIRNQPYFLVYAVVVHIPQSSNFLFARNSVTRSCNWTAFRHLIFKRVQNGTFLNWRVVSCMSSIKTKALLISRSCIE